MNVILVGFVRTEQGDADIHRIAFVTTSRMTTRETRHLTLYKSIYLLIFTKYMYFQLNRPRCESVLVPARM